MIKATLCSVKNSIPVSPDSGIPCPEAFAVLAGVALFAIVMLRRSERQPGHGPGSPSAAPTATGGIDG